MALAEKFPVQNRKSVGVLLRGDFRVNQAVLTPLNVQYHDLLS